ncbi:helix-turn-helix domain-containing protein [Prevotella sp. KH2C16]|uniref:helix-turn-helix domain-containing protein n=1 Tax=Prevotella sp. KH2C16 TaxID=1855325 RepID=UPI0008E57CDA|nr:helix-turn-helix domain-containing protein [Prevotella sp. KH2C16]SFG12841.1 Helix-turn-helix domain-containing protein [Prevotella sp. KH2C16]
MTRGRVSAVEKVWLSSKEARAYLGMGEAFLKNMRDSGRLHFYKVGAKAVFYRKADLDRLIAGGKVI